MVRTAVYSISQPHLVNWGGVLAVIMWANPYGRVLFTSDPGVVWWWDSEAFSSTEVANICTNQYTNVGYEWNELDCYWTWNEIRNTSRLLVVIVIKTGIEENLVLPRRCLRSPGTQGNTRILVYRDTSKLLIMNMQFILAALVYSSSAESNRVLSDIPFGPAKSHIRRLRIANILNLLA